MHSNSCVCVLYFWEEPKKNTYITYHFSRAEVLGVYLDMDHSCLFATAHLFLVFTFPATKTKTLRRRNIFRQPPEGSAVLSCLPNSLCAVCFFNALLRQNMSVVLFFWDQHTLYERSRTPSTTCWCFTGQKREVNERWDRGGDWAGAFLIGVI